MNEKISSMAISVGARRATWKRWLKSDKISKKLDLSHFLQATLRAPMDEKFSNMAIMVTNEQKKSLVRVIGPKKIWGPPWLTERRTENINFKEQLNVGIRVVRGIDTN